MDFVNYCIETKNYSALKAIRGYSEEVRTFSGKSLSNKQKIALAATVPAAAVLTTLAVKNKDKLSEAKKDITDFVEEKTNSLRDRYNDLKNKIKSIGKSSDEDNDSDDADESADNE